LRAGRALVFVLLCATLAVAVAVGFSWLRGGAPSAPAAHAAAEGAVSALPAAPRPAFVPHRPVLLPRHERVARWAWVQRETAAHSEPSEASTQVATLELSTPEDTANLVLVLAERQAGGELWVRVRLPILPNGSTGWVPRAALGGYTFVHTHLIVDRSHLRATLYRDGRPVFTAPVGVGTPEAPTPAGEFYIRDRLGGFGNPFYGPLAFGTSARSAVLTDWPGGGFVGIHGTNEPQLIPGHISHGCVRLRNADILALGRLMPVGTPVSIR